MISYTEKTDRMWDSVRPIMFGLFVQMAKLLGKKMDDVWDNTDEEYGFMVGNDEFSITGYMTEEKIRDGEEGGYGILIDAVEDGGRVLASFAPDNYTPEVFTKSEDELIERLKTFSPREFVAVAKKSLKEVV